MALAARLVPRTIAAQIAGLVVMAAVIAFAMLSSALLMLMDPPAILARFSGGLARVESLVRLLDALPAAERSAVLAEAARGQPPPELRPQAGIARGIALPPLERDHLERLAPALLRSPRVLMLAIGGDGGELRATVAVAGEAGTALVFAMAPDPGGRRGGVLPALTWIVLVACATVTLSLYAARWLIRPLTAFAAAADSYGRAGSVSGPLPERGPREVALVARAFNRMDTRIRNLVGERTRMLMAIGHDLRTPLTRMRLRAERVAVPAEREGMLRDIARLDAMIAETLRYLRDEGAAEPAARVDLPSLLETICADAADSGHEVTYAGPRRHPYECRPGALARAIQNLVDNAIPHGIAVRVALVPDGDGGATITVSDDGPGIAPDLRERVFEPFFRGDGARAEAGRGFGLGLSIARDIVRGHGGELTLDSPAAAPGAMAIGTVATLRLPPPDPTSRRGRDI